MQWTGPIPFLERFIKLMNLQHIEYIKEAALQLLRHVIKNGKLFLMYKPSKLAAACLLIAINISRSEIVSSEMGFECLADVIPKNGFGALGWWTIEVE